jgi:outer membrane protein assembly factor BamE (lipoprotein component of BamABCDE complex)
MSTKSFIRTFVVFALLLVGCATANKISDVRMGLTREEVIGILGKPVSVSAQGGCEYLNYSLSETDNDAMRGWTRPYYVRLVNGRVESYGRTGDFDSTKTPTVRLETDNRSQSDVSVRKETDLYTELKKLKELLDEGLITQREYEARRQKVMEVK